MSETTTTNKEDADKAREELLVSAAAQREAEELSLIHI